MNITLTFNVKRLKSAKVRHEFATSLVEHVLETFNDDGLIDGRVSVVVVATAMIGAE